MTAMAADDDKPSPWSLVRIAFAHKAARQVLAWRTGKSSDEFEELTAFVLVEVGELAARGVAPSRRAYRLAAYHGVRSLWHRARGVDQARHGDVDLAVEVDNEVGYLFRIIASRVRSRLDDRNQRILDAYLAGFSTPEIAAERGETEAAIHGALQRIFGWMSEESGPARPRRATPKPAAVVAPRQCADCAVALVVPEGLRSPPRRCNECQHTRRLAAKRARYAGQRLPTDPETP